MLSTSPITSPNAEMRHIRETDTAHPNAGGATGTRTPDPLLAKRDTPPIADTTRHDTPRQDTQQNVCATTVNDSTRQENSPNNSPAFDLVRNHIVGNGHRASRYARMNPKGDSAKYTTVHAKLTDEQIQAHLAGTSTYAAIIIGADGLVSAACIELDTDSLQGAGRVLEAAQIRKICAFAIAVKGAGNHDGSHTWILFADRVKPANAAHLARQIATDAGYSDAEIWPKGNAIRLPFGLHTHTQKRGRLLLQSGLVYELDDADDLDAGARVVAGLPLNEKPAEPPKVERNRATVAQLNTTASSIAAYNRAHDLKAMMEQAGATLADAHNSLYHCGCGNHTSGNPSLQIMESDNPDRRGKYIAWSYSPNCRWAPLQSSGKYQDAYGFAGSPAFEKKTILHIVQDTPRYTQEQRAAYNAARREKRYAENRQALEQVANCDTVSQLTPRARALFDYLSDLGRKAGVLQVRPTNEQLVEALDMCKRYVQYAFRELEAAGLGKRHGGRGGLDAPNEAAIWTFYRSPSLGCKTHQDAECTLDIDIRDHQYQPLEASEREPAATLDEWEACDVEIDLRAVMDVWDALSPNLDEANDLRPNLDQGADSLRPNLAQATQPADRMALVATLETMTDDELRAWMQGVVNLTTLQPAEPEPDAPGASYVGEVLIVDDPRAVPSWLRPIGDIGPMVRKAEEVSEIYETVQISDSFQELGNLPEPEPEIRCPPADPEKRDEYYKLLGKAKKASSPGQRIALNRKADEMMEWRPASEARARSQAPPTYRLPPASIGRPHYATGGD